MYFVNLFRAKTDCVSVAYTMDVPSRPSSRADFHIGIICALQTEYDAVCAIFDQFWDEYGDPYGRVIGDYNTYTTGCIGKHNVVLTLLPEMGKVNAAVVATAFRFSYHNLEIVLLVGICAGVPNTGGGDDEILMGDVIISKRVIQYDFGRKYTDAFVWKDTREGNLGKARKNILTLIQSLETDRGRHLLQEQTADNLRGIQRAGMRRHRGGRLRDKYAYPGAACDRLFQANYLHKHLVEYDCSICNIDPDAICDEARRASCAELGCDEGRLVHRESLSEKQRFGDEEAQLPLFHIGAIASGDTVMKCGLERDRIAASEGVIAFEMEAAGIWEELPSIMVKSVCDYADGHKNKEWQNFAAATAAAAAKAIIGRYTKTERPSEEPAQQSIPTKWLDRQVADPMLEEVAQQNILVEVADTSEITPSPTYRHLEVEVEARDLSNE